MKGDAKVIEHLNKILGNELVAINQYFLHARMFKNWGLKRLDEHEYHESIDEMKHADELIKRILFLEGEADLSKRDPLNVGASVPEILRNDLDLEYQVTADLKAAMKVCEEEKDYQSRDILLGMLADTEEDHAWWLERQLRLIDAIGLPNYLQSQM